MSSVFLLQLNNHVNSRQYKNWDISTINHKVYFSVYSANHFSCRGRFPVFLNEILLKIKFQWQFWILLVLRISKHPQNVEFDKDLAELLKVKHNTSHMKNFQLFSQQQSL